MFGLNSSVVIFAILTWVVVILSILLPIFVYRISVNSGKILKEAKRLSRDVDDLLTAVKGDIPEETQQSE